MLASTLITLLVSCTITDVPASKEEKVEEQQEPIEEVKAAFADLQTAWETEDVDRIMSAYSNDYIDFEFGSGKPESRSRT